LVSDGLGRLYHSRAEKELGGVVEIAGHVGVVDLVGFGEDVDGCGLGVDFELDLADYFAFDGLGGHGGSY